MFRLTITIALLAALFSESSAETAFGAPRVNSLHTVRSSKLHERSFGIPSLWGIRGGAGKKSLPLFLHVQDLIKTSHSQEEGIEKG